MDKLRSVVELDIKEIAYKLEAHPNSAHTAADAAKELGLSLGQIVKSLLVEGQKHPPVLLLVPGDHLIHFGRLGKILGDRSVFLCSPERTLEVTGYQVGLVTPFGLKADIPIIIDHSVFKHSTVVVSSGDWGFEITISSEDLINATGGSVESIAKDKVPV